MRSRNLLLTFLLATIIGGCWYEPEEVYENPIEPVTADKFHISLDDISNADTIKLLGPATFSYSLIGSASGKPQVKVTLGTRQLPSTSTPPTGTFQVRDSDLKTGVYDLKIEIVTGTGSGSLADSRGEETVTVLGQWVVMIFVDRPNGPQLTSSIVNGYHVISWAPYTSKYFTSYKLETEYNGKAGKQKTFTNKSITSWMDSTFSGNAPCKYTLTITNQVGSSTSTYIATSDGIVMTADFNKNDSTATIQFTSSKYYAANSHYVVMEGDVERMQISDITQTTATFKLNDVGYGYTPLVRLKRIPKESSQATEEVGRQVTVIIPTKTFYEPLEEIFFNQDLNGIYGFRDLGSQAQLVRYDLATFAPIDSVTIFDTPSIDIPYKGQNAYFIRSGQIVQLNLVTGTEKVFTAITSGSGLTITSAASNEFVSYQWYTTSVSNSRTHRYAVYNMATNTMVLPLSSLPGSSIVPPGDGYLSDDGKYYRSYGKFIYDLDQTPPLNVGVHIGNWQGFREDKADEFFTVSGEFLNTYDAATLTQKKGLTVFGASFVTYDVAARKLIFTNTTLKKVYAVDIDTDATATYNVNASGFFVANGMLITKSGEYFRLY